jgi:hypothetical protein
MSNEVRETDEWIKARPLEDGQPCVEMRRHAGAIEVRDSKDPDGPVLRYTSAEWAAWLDGAKKGEFDHLAAFPEA